MLELSANDAQAIKRGHKGMKCDQFSLTKGLSYYNKSAI